MRLAKYLASAGVASRRAAEEIVWAGRVSVGGVCVRDPAREVCRADEVNVDGVRVVPEQARVVYAVNKPAGIVCTARDPQRRPTIVSLVPAGVRLYPVGRLDIDTTGLILLTNDGELAHHLTHPRFGVEKTYRAVVSGAPVRERALRALREGVVLQDGRTAPARVTRLAADTLELTIREGRKRQVRRMCERVGHPVRVLERISFGPLELGELRPGAHRRLSATEVLALTNAGRGDRRRPAASPPVRGRSFAASVRRAARRPAEGR
ncbi:MAG: rRNA pseudouridine synthase [Solirubrobacterales bacterium]|nr:MAG: rRNA pseudouridine synthase [Solirubrobacterales bacterium]